jgi:transposase
MGRSKNGEAVRGERRLRPERRRLKRLLAEAVQKKELDTWRRAKAVLDYIEGKSVIALSQELGVNRSAINHWLIWFQAQGTEGLRTKKAPGGIPRLTNEQYEKLISLIEGGPVAAGFSSGLWTGPMIGQLIRLQFGVKYHNHHVPRLLHKLGFSVQRPRRRLARADHKRQAVWLKKTFPAIKKKRPPVAGRSSSATRRASGSMARSTRLGRESESSPESIPTASERQLISSAPSA